MTDRKTHWDNIHSNKRSTEVSWYQAEPKRSIELICEFSTHDSRVIDVGGGQSFLVDSLLDLGYRNLTVLDVAQPDGRPSRSACELVRCGNVLQLAEPA